MSTLGGKVFASVGRIIIFKECLKNNIIPFIILDKDKLFYYRGLKEYKREKRKACYPWG